MISKTFITGKTFRESCLYVCEDLERAQILEAEGVRKHDLRLMAEDFETQQAWANQVKENPVYHTVLSYPHGGAEAFRKLVAEEEERRAEEVEKVSAEEANHQDADSLYRGERIK